MIIVKNRELLIPGDERFIGTPQDNRTDIRIFRLKRYSQNGYDLSNLTFRMDLKYPDTRKVYSFTTSTSRADRSVVVMTQHYTAEYPNAGTKTFTFNGTTWNDGSQNVSLNEIGVVINFTPNNGDTITVVTAINNVETDTVLLTKEVDDENINLTWDITAGQTAVPGTVFVNLRGSDGDGEQRYASFPGVFYVDKNVYSPNNYAGNLSELEQLENQLVTALRRAEYLSTDYEDLEEAVEDAEAWAKGTRGGVAVGSSDQAYHNNAKFYRQYAERYAKGTEDGAAVSSGDGYLDNAKYWSEQSDGYSNVSEAYAKGTVDGTDVTSGQTGYQDNSKYYKEQADAHRKTAERFAKGTEDGTAVASGDGYHDNAKYYKEQVQSRLNQIDTNATNIAAQTARIDSFVALADGSTTGDAELQDIRVGQDGVTYNSAGTAVRTQFSDVKSQIDSITVKSGSKNLLDFNALLEGYALDYNSAHTTYGYPVADSPSITTALIPVTPGKTYYSTKIGSSGLGRDKQGIDRYAYYSANKQLLSYEGGNNDGVITAPANAAYMRATLRNTTTPWTIQRAETAQWMIYEFDDLYYRGLPFEPYVAPHSEVDADTVNTEQNLSILFEVSRNKNLLTYGNIIDYVRLNSDTGAITTNSTSCTTEFIPVEEQTTYFCSNIDQNTGLRVRRSVAVAFYDNNKQFISFQSNNYTFVTPVNAKYLRIYWSTNDGYTASKVASLEWMLEKGANATTYVAPDGQYRISPVLFDAETKAILADSKNVNSWQKFKQPRKRLMTISHRGVISGIPSNTLPAFEYAAQYGCDYVEFDVRKTADDNYVIYHDSSITISGVTKNIIEFTLAEIKTYRFSSYAGTEYEDTEIPTLEETLQCLIKNNIFACADIKNSASELSDADIEDIYNIFAEYGMTETTIFTGDVDANRQRLLKLNPYLTISVNFKYAAGVTINRTVADACLLFNGLSTIVCALPVENITAENIATLKSAGVNFFNVGAGLGGSINLPDALLKYVHFKAVELSAS